MKFKNLICEDYQKRMEISKYEQLKDDLPLLFDNLKSFPLKDIVFFDLELKKPSSIRQVIKVARNELDPKNIDHDDEYLLLICKHETGGITVFWGNFDYAKIYGLDSPECVIGDVSGKVSDAFVSTFFRNLML